MPTHHSAMTSDYQSHINILLEQTLSDYQAVAQLKKAMQYSTLSGGKRIRAGLVYAAATACDTPEIAADRAAIAIELMHAFSLIHDDLPVMDDDVLRRGKPTCHIAFDEATAILAGDALQTLAFEVLSRPLAQITPAQQLQMVHHLAQASGANGMAGGQWIDVDTSHKTLTHQQCLHMHALKTGCLIEASVMMALAASAHWKQYQWQQILRNFARHIGVAFQIQDDILDITAHTNTLGKTAGKDIEQGKNNIAIRCGLEQAKALCQRHFEQACDAVGSLPDHDQLKTIAKLIVWRGQ